MAKARASFRAQAWLSVLHKARIRFGYLSTEENGVNLRFLNWILTILRKADKYV